jgi:hypothetical protein
MPWVNQKYGGFSQSSAGAESNVIMFRDILQPIGWSLSAIAALAGNSEYEGGLNPWRWESDDVLSYGDPLIDTSYSHGYGLFQFTPAGKYISDTRAQALTGYGPNYDDVTGSQNDGTAQLLFVNSYADYYPTSTYPLTFAEFKTSNQTPEYLAAAWVYNYERPADPAATITGRQTAARYWYDFLGGQPGGGGIFFIKKKKNTLRRKIYMLP